MPTLIPKGAIIMNTRHGNLKKYIEKSSTPATKEELDNIRAHATNTQMRIKPADLGAAYTKAIEINQRVILELLVLECRLKFDIDSEELLESAKTPEMKNVVSELIRVTKEATVSSDEVYYNLTNPSSVNMLKLSYFVNLQRDDFYKLYYWHRNVFHLAVMANLGDEILAFIVKNSDKDFLNAKDLDGKTPLDCAPPDRRAYIRYLLNQQEYEAVFGNGSASSPVSVAASARA
jgi:hypothetical protein